MDNEQTVPGAVDELLEQIGEFWPVLEADDQLGADDRAELTKLIEDAEASIKDAKNLLHDISERE